MDTATKVFLGILLAGSIGNVISMAVFSRIKTPNGLKKLNINNMLIVKLISDTLNLIMASIGILRTTIVYAAYCKISDNLAYALPAYSAWINVFVSIERLVSVLFSRNSIAKLFENAAFQLVGLLAILIICLVYYCIFWIFDEISYVKFVNGTYVSLIKFLYCYYFFYYNSPPQKNFKKI
jgi:hypothetical protein